MAGSAWTFLFSLPLLILVFLSWVLSFPSIHVCLIELSLCPCQFWCHLDPKPPFIPSPLGTGASVSSSVSWAGGCHLKSLIWRPRWDPVCGHCSHGGDGEPVLNLPTRPILIPGQSWDSGGSHFFVYRTHKQNEQPVQSENDLSWFQTQHCMLRAHSPV